MIKLCRFKGRPSWKTAVLCTLVAAVVLVGLFLEKGPARNPQKQKTLNNLKNIPNVQIFKDFIDPDKFQYSFFGESSFSLMQRENFRNKSNVGKVRIYNPTGLRKLSTCVPLKTPRGPTPICIYRTERDKMISSYIKDYGTWEPDLLQAMGQAFSSVPDMHLVDLGCSIGVYTLYAAKLGRKVVSVDALKSNLFLLRSSLVHGRLQENVTLVLNAISDKREDVFVYVGHKNIGGTHVKTWQEAGQSKDTIDKKPVVRSILLDDLLQVVKFNKVFLKIDIERSEVKALRGASAFFQTVDVRYILMEWMMHRSSREGMQIITFLLRNGFLPYTDVGGKEFLRPDHYGMWPDNMVWIKR